MTMCSAYAYVHCLSIVSICSMYVFSVHEPYVYVIVSDWMRSLFSVRAECTHTRVCSSTYSAHRPCDWLNGPWPDLLFTQKHTYNPPSPHTQGMWHPTFSYPQLSPHPCTNTSHLLFWDSEHSSNLVHTKHSHMDNSYTHTPECEQLVCVCVYVCREGSGWDVCVTANADERGRK